MFTKPEHQQVSSEQSPIVNERGGIKQFPDVDFGSDQIGDGLRKAFAQRIWCAEFLGCVGQDTVQSTIEPPRWPPPVASVSIGLSCRHRWRRRRRGPRVSDSTQRLTEHVGHLCGSIGPIT